MYTIIGYFIITTFGQDRFQLSFKKHAFIIDFVTIKHTFIEFAVSLLIIQFRMFVLVTPCFHLFKSTALHITWCLSVQNQTVSAFRLFGRGMGRGEIQGKVQAIGSTALHVKDDNVVRMGCKNLTFILYSVLFKDCTGNSIGNIQFPPVTGDFTRLVILDKQIAERLVILVQASQPVFADQVGSLVIFPGFHQSDNPVEHFRCDPDILKRR